MIKLSSDPCVAESQMLAIIQHLVAFAYIDADFDPAERAFIRQHIAELVEQRARDALNGMNASPELLERWTRHFDEVLEQVDHRIQGYFRESVAQGETSRQFVLSRLKLGCFELLRRFDEDGQREILGVVEQLMHADGVVHPEELTFRDELLRLVEEVEEVAAGEIQLAEAGEVIVAQSRRPRPSMANHPFLTSQEWDFARDPLTFARQAAIDMDLARRLMANLDRQRAAGQGKLQQLERLSDLSPGTQFLDGYVWVVAPDPGTDYELLVLGDLHGCYSCLKAALLQVDFFAKARAHADDPAKNPPVFLVFLGDYIDRGRFGLSGTLRMAMQLQLELPAYVFPLRGNHEYYVELDGKVLAPVRPCEAMDSISAVAGHEVLASYMNLFEALPNMLFFGDMLFVHGGIPRGDTFAERFRNIASLNDEDLRFQMMWSDPSEADVIPLDLQRASARFPFGRRQFRHFMSRVGCRVMVRGHEMVEEGFRIAYDDPDARLFTVFSAGGQDNEDLPADSHFRSVKPKAVTIHHRAGISTVTPLEIDYQRYNDPLYNAFFSGKPCG